MAGLEKSGRSTVVAARPWSTLSIQISHLLGWAVDYVEHGLDSCSLQR